MELGRSGPLPLDLQALLPYHRVEYANTEFPPPPPPPLTRVSAVLNIAEFGTSLMALQEQCHHLHGEQFRDKQKACKMQLFDVRSVCGSAISWHSVEHSKLTFYCEFLSNWIHFFTYSDGRVLNEWYWWKIPLILIGELNLFDLVKDIYEFYVGLIAHFRLLSFK